MIADCDGVIDKNQKVEGDNIYSGVGDFTAGDEKASAQETAGKAMTKPPVEIDPRDLERNHIKRRFTMLDPEPIFDWENHHVIGLNREPSHCLHDAIVQGYSDSSVAFPGAPLMAFGVLLPCKKRGFLESALRTNGMTYFSVCRLPTGWCPQLTSHCGTGV
jgi:hypothetical protein